MCLGYARSAITHVSLGDCRDAIIAKGSDRYFRCFSTKNVYRPLPVVTVSASVVLLEVLASYYPKSNKALAAKAALKEQLDLVED